jgi:hypothetical protein
MVVAGIWFWKIEVNAIHSSSFPDGSYGGNPEGLLLKESIKNIYIAGDTALTMDEINRCEQS